MKCISAVYYTLLLMCFSTYLNSCEPEKTYISIGDCYSIGTSYTTQTTNEECISTLETTTYCHIDLVDGISYEVPIDWNTTISKEGVYHYYNNDVYLMVSSRSSGMLQDTDQVLTNSCADTLLDTIQRYSDYILISDHFSNIDGVYYKKLVYSYVNQSGENVSESSVIFTINGTVYSFDYISLGDYPLSDTTFNRIISSIIVTD